MAYPNIRPLFFLSLILKYFSHITTAQLPIFIQHFCINATGNYTNNSTYESNLDRAFLEITSSVNATAYGFSNTSVGQNSDTANALALCRGDIDSLTCGQCVYNATLELKNVCPNRKEAIGWYDLCMLSYSNRSLVLQNLNNDLVFFAWSQNNISNVARFNQDLRSLFDTLRPRAAAGSSLQKYAAGNVSGPDFLTIYGLMQCIPILSDDECDRCLALATRDIATCCDRRQGGRVVRDSCNLRYEIDPFFTVTNILGATPPTPSQQPLPLPLPTTEGPDDNTTRTIVVIGVPIVVSMFLVIACIWIFKSIRKKRNPNTKLENVNDMSLIESLQYDLETITTATDNFSESNKLGQGGFGVVYKGKLPNGEVIAVKRLAENSGQGEVEFKNEVVLLAKLQHRNLVRLFGFCLEGTERILIYEFVRNASLDHFIFDAVNKADLDWGRCYKVIGGVARGLLYLHEDSRLRIIHRDLKASNILLDEDMNPKIAEFGIARLFERDDESQGSTSRIVGTYRYMAPEYAIHGKFSVKSDVFSFGVLVLEIVSGQRNNGLRNGVSTESLLSYAWVKWQGQRFNEFIDPVLSSSPISDMIKCIHIGLLCVQENVGDRPTMASVVLMLNSDSIALPIPCEPAFFNHNMAFGPENSYSGGSNSAADRSADRNNKSADASIDDKSITKLYPR